MRYYYQSSFASFKIAQRAYIRSSWKRRLSWHFFMWGMLVCGLSVLLFASMNRGSFFSERAAPILVGGLVAGGLVSSILRPLQLRRSYRMWNGDDTKEKRCFIEIDGPQFISGIEGRSEGRFQRNAILQVFEDEQILLLFVRKKVFLYFAKNRVPAEAFVEIHAWLERAGTGDHAY